MKVGDLVKDLVSHELAIVISMNRPAFPTLVYTNGDTERSEAEFLEVINGVVVELVDTTDLKSVARNEREGSSPSSPTTLPPSDGGAHEEG